MGKSLRLISEAPQVSNSREVTLTGSKMKYVQGSYEENYESTHGSFKRDPICES